MYFKAPFPFFSERTAATSCSCFTTHFSNPLQSGFFPITLLKLCKVSNYLITEFFQFSSSNFSAAFYISVEPVLSFFLVLLIGSFFCWITFLPLTYTQELFHPSFPTVILICFLCLILFLALD